MSRVGRASAAAVLAIALAALGAYALGAIVTTESNLRWELHDKDTRALVAWPADHAACIAEIKRLAEIERADESRYTCVMRVDVLATGVCDDVPKPTPEPPQTDLYAVQDPLDDNVWHNMVPGWVKANYSKGCWEIGLVDLKYDPNAPTDEPVHEPVCYDHIFPDDPCVPASPPPP